MTPTLEAAATTDASIIMKDQEKNNDEHVVTIPTTVLPWKEGVAVVDNMHHDENNSPKGVVTIMLDAEEEKLFNVLVNTALAYERGEIQMNDDDKMAQEKNRHIEVRVAGGWVRDKILGLQTHDVDVALDCCTGVQFAKLVQEYSKLLQQSSEDKVDDDDNKADDDKAEDKKNKKGGRKRSSSLCGKIGVIAANPAQSKHLETATMKVYGIDVDFCNLRSEEYVDAGSRIPTMLFGTPLQDAERRDFTINALYYNLRSQSVEDYTRRGYQDLCCSMPILLRTPLDPYVTFLDDPLRVLRAIRFAVRYHCLLDDDLKTACKLEEIHHALHMKVSRERVGKELEGMLSGKGCLPTKALSLINELRLAGSIFCLPKSPTESGYQDQQDQIIHTHHLTNHNVSSVYGTIVVHKNNDNNDNNGNDNNNDTNNSFEGSLPYQGNNQQLAHLRALGWEESNRLLELLPQVQSYFESISTTRQQQQQQQQSKESEETTKQQPQKGKNKKKQQAPIPTGIDERILPLALFLLPFRNLYYSVEKSNKGNNENKKKKKKTEEEDESAKGGGGKEFPVVSFMFRDGIKFKNKDVQAITTIMTHVEEMVQFLTQTAAAAASNDDKPTTTDNGNENNGHRDDSMVQQVCRLEAGLLLRATKEYWVTTLLLATVLLVRRQQQQQQQQQQSNNNNGTVVVDWLQVCLRDIYLTIVNEMKLDECWKTKPLINGKAVMDILQLKQGGPIISSFLDEQMKWMLLHPNGTIEECEEHLRYIHHKRTLHQNSDLSQSTDNNNGKTTTTTTSTTEKELKHFSKKLHLMDDKEKKETIE